MSSERPSKRKHRLVSNNLEIDMRFNENFNENRSRRMATKTTFDSAGRYRATRIDACDCLDANCVGCFFPCKQCGKTKCGTFCRQNRDDIVVSIRTEGKSSKITNPHYESQGTNGSENENK